jgi:suppressor of fused
MENAAIRAAAEAGRILHRYLLVDRLDWREERLLLREALLEVVLEASTVARLCAMLPLRLPFGREFAIRGEGRRLLIRPAEQDCVMQEEKTLTLDLSPATQGAVVARP